MGSLQYRVLYRVFLMRMVDLDLLSADADPMRLIGQFLTIFSSISLLFCLPLLMMTRLSVSDRWIYEHFFFETTITIAGLIAILNWDSAFPDRRDVLVLGPLPVRSSTLFLAKLAALATPPFLTIVALNVFTGLAYPMLFHSGTGFFNGVRAWPAYWVTLFLGGAFIVLTMLAVQGLAANLLPRQLFLRVSGVLQASAFSLLLLVYFLEPSLELFPELISSPTSQRLMEWLPSYWFLGLFNQLNGSLYPAMVPLARRAWIALAISAIGGGLALLLSYFRMLPRVVEQPEILPMARGLKWPHRVSSLNSAILFFSIRTLLRSRQHRMILSFYLGIGLAVVVGYVRSPLSELKMHVAEIDSAALLTTTLMVILMVMALRVVSSIPVTLAGNWIVQVTQLRPAREYLRAVRFSWLMLGVAPIWLGAAALLMGFFSLAPVAGHLLVLFLLGMLLVELCLHGFPKIPFTCAYLPGKAKIHFVFWASLMMGILLLDVASKLEVRALDRPWQYFLIVLGFVVAVARMGWVNDKMASRSEGLLFEDEYAVEIVSLKLQ
jgi:hypothetical protein